jgi:hypothetical protein
MATRSFKGGLKRISTEQWLVPLVGIVFLVIVFWMAWG